MRNKADIPPDDLKRIPGLFRRWELPEVFEAHRGYHIEEAGAHADGTPLLALYTREPGPDEGTCSPQVGGGDAPSDPRDAVLAGLLPDDLIAALPLLIEIRSDGSDDSKFRPLFTPGGATIGELRAAIRDLDRSVEDDRRTLRALSGLLVELVAHGGSASTPVGEMLRIIAIPEDQPTQDCRAPQHPSTPPHRAAAAGTIRPQPE